MTTIYFTKRFESGLLKGLSVLGKCTFSDVKTAALLIHKGKRGKDCLTGDRFIITDASFQSYAR